MPIRPPVHQPFGAQSATERRARYRPDGRTSDPMYSLQRWKKLRRAYLATHPLCECSCLRAAVEVDHRIPHHGDPKLMWDWGNLQALTKECHSRKTATEMAHGVAMSVKARI